MKFVIVGCGRVGSTLAENLDAAGHEVIIVDVRTAAFDRLPDSFKGSAVRGDGTDEEVLRRAGAEGADTFLALTEGDNRNVMASQVAAEALAIPHVICKINDPVRAAAYADLGVVTLCRTNLMVHEVSEYLNLDIQTGPGINVPENPGHNQAHPGQVRATAGRGAGASTRDTAARQVSAAVSGGPASGERVGAASGPPDGPTPEQLRVDAGTADSHPARGLLRWRS